MSELRFNFLNWRPDLEDYANDGMVKASNCLHDVNGYVESRTMNTGAPLVTNSTNTMLSVRAIEVVGGIAQSFSEAFSESEKVNYLVAGADGGVSGILRAGPAHTLTSAYAATAIAGEYSSTSVQVLNFAELEDDGVMSIRHREYSGGFPQGTITSAGYFTKANGQYTATLTSLTVLDENSATTPPAVVSTVNAFVMGGNMGDLAPGNSAVQWCAIGDATDWPTPNTDDARSKQSGREYLNPTHGEVTHVAGDDFFAYVFQQTAITKMTYVGGDTVFAVDTFEEVRGAWSFNHVTRIDDAYFFESRYGRHVLENGVVQDIGDQVNDTYPPDHTGNATVCANPAIHTIFFTNGVRYNYKTGQFTHQPNITPVFSINDADGIIGQWVQGVGEWYLTNSNGGTAETATFETGAFGIDGRVVVNGIRPLVTGGTYAIRVGEQDNINDAVTWVTGTSVNTRTGYSNLRAEGRYLRAEVVVSGGFTAAVGIDIDQEPQGKV